MKSKILLLVPLLTLFGLTSCNENYVQNEEEYRELMDGRSVDENWKEHTVSIKHREIDHNKYETCEPGDYITAIENHAALVSGYRILYATNFYVWDDLETQFIFDNGYTTPIETTHHSFMKDTIRIPDSDVEKYDLVHATIVKIRVRTVD